MISQTPPGPTAARHGWVQALATVLAGTAAMGLVAALGLWAAGAAGLPDAAFPRVAAAVVVLAVGGSVDLSGDAGVFAGTRAELTVVPLSVTLTGVLVIGAGFLRPLRHRALTSPAGTAGWAARIAAVWFLALLGLALATRQTFAVSLGDGALGAIGDLFDASPTVSFEADVPLTLVLGLLWLAGVMVLALLVSRGPAPPGRWGRFLRAVRSAAYAMAALLLAQVALGIAVGLVVAFSRGYPAETFAVILLGLPNLVWPVFTIGLGATWEGRVDGPFGLPMPHLLDEVLRTPDISALNLSTLAEHDARVWWLVAVDAVLVSAAAYLAAARSPSGVRAWRHAVTTAVALALTVLVICLAARLSARYGLSLLGLGDVGGGLSGTVLLRPRWGTALGFALLWGLVAGFAAGAAARRLRRRNRPEDGRTPGA
ncbi:streptophobe family protein [Streptomyces sp. NPDC008313]|uniref:streptophobe family protein n=1 Tax=Streptomyces sp. NPDC008313 TaxID=3364826 RepID=UPI0036E4603A